METRILLPGKRICLCQGKEEGRGPCRKEMEMLDMETVGSPKNPLDPATFSGRGSLVCSQRPHWLATVSVLVSNILRATLHERGKGTTVYFRLEINIYHRSLSNRHSAAGKNIKV